MRGASEQNAVLFVSESIPSKSNFSVANSLGAELVRIDEFSARNVEHDPTMVFDVDLSRIDNVRRLKTALVRRGQGCRLFLVDPNSRVTSVHANVLGADVLQPRTASAADIGEAIRKHFGTARITLANAEVIESINSGVAALDQSFRAMTENGELDTAGVLHASGRIADSMAGLGVEEWLATVKGYHIGTFQHCMLVTGVAAAFGSKTGMARRDVVRLTIAGLLHDIGKSAVPLEILDKPGALTDAETQLLRQHPVTGHAYLTAYSTIDAVTLGCVRHHHEFLDGSGYPDRLKGVEIDDLTRIITICDVYAALIERRSYKAPKSPAQAMTILNGMAEAGKVETSLVRALGTIVLPR